MIIYRSTCTLTYGKKKMDPQFPGVYDTCSGKPTEKVTYLLVTYLLVSYL